MVWLMIGVPAASVVAGILTVVVAVRSGGQDTAIDEVRRTAQIQQTDLSADRQALQRGLSATLVRAGDRFEVQVLGGVDPTRPLHLRLLHPTESSRDQNIELLPAGDRWTASHPLPAAAGWTLSLQSSEGDWRLDGTLPQGQDHAVLLPRFGDG